MSVEATSRLLTPLAIAGILLLVPGGLILFIADAGPLAANSLLQIKLVLVVLGLANAVLFRMKWGGKNASWDADPPGLGRAQVIASVAIWLDGADDRQVDRVSVKCCHHRAGANGSATARPTTSSVARAASWSAAEKAAGSGTAEFRL